MKVYFFFLSADDLRDPLKTGYSYAKSKRSEWVENSNLEDKLFTGFQVGNNYVVYKDKVYWFYKQFTLVDENAALMLCKESEQGCDTKKF